MSSTVCDRCHAHVEQSYRYCPWCAAPLRLKIVEYFPADPTVDSPSEGLRVSRYFGEHCHSRISIWSAGRAEAVVSLDAETSVRLGRFLSPPPEDAARAWRELLQRNVRALRHALTG